MVSITASGVAQCNHNDSVCGRRLGHQQRLLYIMSTSLFCQAFTPQALSLHRPSLTPAMKTFIGLCGQTFGSLSLTSASSCGQKMVIVNGYWLATLMARGRLLALWLLVGRELYQCRSLGSGLFVSIASLVLMLLAWGSRLSYWQYWKLFMNCYYCAIPYH